MSHQRNMARIRAVHRALGELADKVVFVGGATISLYADRPASETRPTDDVDIVVELLNYSGYAVVEEQLRKKGFVNDVESGIICRYRVEGIVVDVMPTGKEVLGFANPWHAEGFARSAEKEIDPGCIIKILEPPFFIASKLEAFRDRGGGDGRTSSDFEDLVYVLNNRNTIWDEMKEAPSKVLNFLQKEFRQLTDTGYLYEWIGAHLEFSEQRRVGFIMGGINDFIR